MRVAAVDEDELRLSPEGARARLAALGFASPDAALRHIGALTLGVSRRAAIQRHLLPVLLDYFSSSPDPDNGLLSYRQVSEALADTPWYLRLLRDEGSVAQRLAGAARRVAADREPAHPGARRCSSCSPTTRRCWSRSRRPSPLRCSPGPAARRSAQESVDAARSARRAEMLRLACGDLLGLISVTNIARGLTSVAETCIRAALRRRGRRR